MLSLGWKEIFERVAKSSIFLDPFFHMEYLKHESVRGLEGDVYYYAYHFARWSIKPGILLAVILGQNRSCLAIVCSRELEIKKKRGKKFKSVGVSTSILFREKYASFNLKRLTCRTSTRCEICWRPIWRTVAIDEAAKVTTIVASGDEDSRSPQKSARYVNPTRPDPSRSSSPPTRPSSYNPSTARHHLYKLVFINIEILYI